MPAVIHPTNAQFEIRAIADGQHIENRLMVDMLTTPTAANLETCAIAIWDAVEANWLDQLPSEVSIIEIVATALNASDGAQFTYAPDTLEGVDTSGILPGNVTLAIKLSSDSRGRSARGRLYWLALSHDMVTASHVGTVRAGLIASAVGAVLVAIRTAGFDPVIMSVRHDGIVRPGGPVNYSIVGATFTDDTTDSQRRRLPGRGQ